MPRPEGRRCLVISAKGQTTSRLRNGALFECFSSVLPNGAPSTQAGADVGALQGCRHAGQRRATSGTFTAAAAWGIVHARCCTAWRLPGGCLRT